MSFDENYFNNHLSKLYTGTNAIYQIDGKLYSMTTKDGVENAFGANDYFKNATIQFVSESKSAVEKREKISEEDFFAPGKPAQPVDQTDPTFPKFSGLIDKEVVAASVARAGASVSFEELLSSIDDEVSVANADSVDHKSMDLFMRGILTASCKHVFAQAQTGVKAPDVKTGWNQAKTLFHRMTDGTLGVVFESLQNLGGEILCNMATAKATAYIEHNSVIDAEKDRKTIPLSYLDDLKIGGFVGPLYYKLRTQMLMRFEPPTQLKITTRNSAFDKQANEYIKMIVVDCFIKFCYPMLIYEYITCMKNLYAKLGDFVNYRIAVLARVMFVYYFHNKIVTSYGQDSSDAKRTKNITDRANALSKYIETIDKEYGTIPETVATLHDMSTKVSKTSQTIESLKNRIQQNQLSMRNVIYNTEQLKNTHRLMRGSFAFLVMLLIAIIVVCSLLVYFEKNLIVLYLAGGLALLLLAIAAIRGISKLARQR